MQAFVDLPTFFPSVKITTEVIDIHVLLCDFCLIACHHDSEPALRRLFT